MRGKTGGKSALQFLARGGAVGPGDGVEDGQDLIEMIGPLWGEADEAKRIAGYKAVDRHIAENAYVIPLLQYVQPIVHADTVSVGTHVSGVLLPQAVKPA